MPPSAYLSLPSPALSTALRPPLKNALPLLPPLPTTLPFVAPPPPRQVHPIPLTDIRAIHKHTPPLGQHRVTLTLTNGVSLPSLHFQSVSEGDSGGRGWRKGLLSGGRGRSAAWPCLHGPLLISWPAEQPHWPPHNHPAPALTRCHPPGRRQVVPVVPAAARAPGALRRRPKFVPAGQRRRRRPPAAQLVVSGGLLLCCGVQARALCGELQDGLGAACERPPPTRRPFPATHPRCRSSLELADALQGGSPAGGWGACWRRRACMHGKLHAMLDRPVP